MQFAIPTRLIADKLPQPDQCKSVVPRANRPKSWRGVAYH
jgi:hypothetical protein